MECAKSAIAHLLPGEFVVRDEPNIGFLSSCGKFLGNFVVTNYRLRFEYYESSQAIDLPLALVSRLEKMGHSTMSRGEDSYGFEIVCKDFRVFRFCSRQENHSRRPLFECLHYYAFCAAHKIPYFAFNNKERYNTDGWNIYQPREEYARMGVPDDHWRITEVNIKYTLAPTYPSLLCIPSKASDEFLVRVAGFRSRNRLPVLCWLHPNGHASLTRSSQPSVGVTARRSQEDEQYLQMIVDTNANANKLCIMDARPSVNAKVNKAKGGGYESEAAYPNAELVFLDIENIHVMRESFKKLREGCVNRNGNSKHWFNNLSESNWFDHLRLVLYGAARIVNRIDKLCTSVLVHCSDGWDRTSQLTSLAMLMLDPYYRTVKGFEVLIEKEWCSFGHKFGQRIGHGEEKSGNAERSPIFLQFLDCVFQLTEQFPNRFQFNSRFLMVIMDEVYNCRFGTFLFNSEYERNNKDVRRRTISAWSYINSVVEQFINPLYSKIGNENDNVLMPCCSVRRIRLWTEYYLRWNAAGTSMQITDDRLRLFKQISSVRQLIMEKAHRTKSTDANADNDRHRNVAQVFNNHSQTGATMQYFQ